MALTLHSGGRSSSGVRVYNSNANFTGIQCQENSQTAGRAAKSPLIPFRYIRADLIWQCSLLEHDFT